MGNSQQTKRSQSFIKKSKSGQANCLACMPNYESYDGSNLDNNELNIFKSFCQPKGKISPKSIAYLSKDEINFFKTSAGRNISAIRYYLKKGVNVNTFDEDRTSPLHVAARHASIQVVEELLNWGALVDITDSDGWTPLHVASYFQRPVVCHLLLKKGANALIPNKDNFRPADLARDAKLKEIFEVHFNKLKDMESGKKEKSQGGLSARNHNLIETETEHKIETPYENKTPIPFISAYNVDFAQKYSSCDSLGNIEEPARIPNLILPKQHKYYLYFKNLKVKNVTNFGNEKNININPLVSYNSLNSLSFSDNNEDYKANYLEKQSELSSVLFCDDSQIADYEESGKKLALNFQINKTSKFNQPNKQTVTPSSMLNKPTHLTELLHIKQNIPFKLKNIYNSTLNVKKGLKFQVNSSHIVAKSTFDKAQLPPKSSFKVANDFGVSKNIAHYNKNPLTANKNFKQQISYTPDSSRSILFVDNKVISLKDFVKDNNNILMNLTIDKIVNQTETKKREWNDHNLITETSYKKMIEIGVDIFNYKAMNGISYMIFIKYIKNSPISIARFLHNQKNINDKKSDITQHWKRDKTQITSFLTNLNIKEILEVLNFYTESFIFGDMPFVSALKFFLNNFIIENDPEKIDILLYAFSKKYFKELRKTKPPPSNENLKDKDKSVVYDNQDYFRSIFQNFDAVHMLSFATIMLDIEIHHMRRKDLENVIKEFNLNVKGLNDGENFPKEFIDSIIENVLTQNLIVLRGCEDKKEKENIRNKSLRVNIMKDADLVINVKKRRKNDKDFVFLQLVMIENLGFIFKNCGEETPVSIFILENCNVKVKGMNFSYVANEKKTNKMIIYGKYNDYENGTIEVKYKGTLEFLLMESSDAKKIVKYVENVNAIKS